MIYTERFYIRQLKPEDVTQLYLDWFNDDIVRRYITTASSTQTIQSLREYIVSRSGRETVLFAGVFLKESGAHIGNIKFEPINIEMKNAVMGILIGDTAWRARGVMAEVLDACFEWLHHNHGIETITLGVDKTNSAAIRAYKKAGFVIETSLESGDLQNSVLRMVRRRVQHAKRLALGTVQFGLNYGVSNITGQVCSAEIDSILSCARGARIDTIDTAISYGSSEENLGKSGVQNYKVITKLPPLPVWVENVEKWVNNQVKNSLDRLKIGALEGLLLHRSSDLCGPKGDQLNEALLRLKQQEFVNKIGVSIYDPLELDDLIGKRHIDLVQAPFNVVDRRLLTSGWMKRLNDSGVELHIRSVFLQGLLLSPELQQKTRFCMWSQLWNDWSLWLQEERLSPLQGCLGFALNCPEIDKIIVGVDTKIQLEKILGSLNIGNRSFPDYLISNDLELIHPSRWANL
jgi:aryl-alcohol dehydrogenase-like predicted oxidoreductase/RimJ/RimL family protein N-acetyltransferase